MREASARRSCGADRRAGATKQAAAAAGPGPAPRGVWSRYPAARGLLCYVLLGASRRRQLIRQSTASHRPQRQELLHQLVELLVDDVLELIEELLVAALGADDGLPLATGGLLHAPPHRRDYLRAR